MITTSPWGYMVLDEDDEPVEVLDRSEKVRLVFADSKVADALAAALSLGSEAIEADAFQSKDGDEG